MLHKIRNFFYKFFGKLLANILGIEIYARIEALEELKFAPVGWSVRPQYIYVNFCVNGEEIFTGGTACKIDYLDAKKLKRGNMIRIKYLEKDPYVICISEFKYFYKEAKF